MENKMNIQGYLECDGTITKISSLDDIQAFITKQKSSENLVTEDFLDNLITIHDRFHMKPNRSKKTEEKRKRIAINSCHTINSA